MFNRAACLASESESAVTKQNGSTKSENPRASQHDLGWKAKRTTSPLPVAGDVFTIDFPLYTTRLPEKFEPVDEQVSGNGDFPSVAELCRERTRVRKSGV